MSILSKFAASFDALFSRLLASHAITFLHVTFITVWLVLKLDLTVLALVLSLEGVTIWTVVLKSTRKIQEIQEKKDRFENKRFREFLENDIKTTEQNLKISKEVFKKLQDLDFKIVEIYEKLLENKIPDLTDKDPGSFKVNEPQAS